MSDAVGPPSVSERMNDLARRALADEDMSLCGFTWMIEGHPHGCCLLPDHDDEHWCSCEETHV